MGTTVSNINEAQRWRSRAAWTFIISGIGYLALVIGLLQYWMTGEVSIRPDNASVAGKTALSQLLFLASFSSLILILGIFFKYLARRKKRQPDLSF
jgi:hypothetical protein